jgi:hypothetical protein
MLYTITLGLKIHIEKPSDTQSWPLAGKGLNTDSNEPSSVTLGCVEEHPRIGDVFANPEIPKSAGRHK